MSKTGTLSHMTTGMIVVIVGYTSSVAIVFQAALAAGANASQISSWLWALGIGMGVSTIGLSLRYRTPILTAWSTPGAALLVTGLSGVPMEEAVGVFIAASLAMLVLGMSGIFDRLMRHIPQPLAAAMLAGVLTRFGMDLFVAMGTEHLMVISMLVAFLLLRTSLPRYAVPLTLGIGLVIATIQGGIDTQQLEWSVTTPTFTLPSFELTSLIGLGVPLLIVNITSQNMPGLAVLRANGYDTPASPLISWTGVTSLLLAPFGCFSVGLAAITAAICMGKEADPDPAQRYKASIWAGAFYLAAGVFGATVASLFAALPTELVLAIAGLALLGTIGNSLHGALAGDESREAALITFLVTASGLTLFDVGSAFWGITFGLLAWHLRDGVKIRRVKATVTPR